MVERTSGMIEVGLYFNFPYMRFFLLPRDLDAAKFPS